VFNSLRFRLAASFILIIVVTLAAAGIALFARLGGYRDELTTSTLRQVAAPIYYNLTLFQPADNERPLIAGRRLRTELDDYLRLQTETTGVVVLPIDANGRVIANPDDTRFDGATFAVPPPPQRGPNFSDLPQGEFTANGETMQYVTVPTTRLVRAQEAGIYAIVVALPQSDGRDVWRDLSPRLIFAGLIGLFAALLTVLVVWASLFRGLGKVTRGLRAVAAGDYQSRVPESGPSEVRALARDVNRMADSVETSQRTLREFLANVSHELRTPLTSIRGFSQAMLDGTLESPEERARAARVIDAESRRVLHLVGELLDLSRIESGQQSMDLADVDAAELLAHVADVFALRSEESGVALVVANSPAGLTARADFDRIEQVLGNLIDNAFRHTPRGGRIDISAATVARLVEFRVADNGEGIADADLPHVFDRFYRSALGERETPGSGLGLAIAREIVRAHGGTIRAESRAGGGTTFSFTLPAASSATERASEQSPETGRRHSGDAAVADT
jgi:signal transduction histidine kinase